MNNYFSPVASGKAMREEERRDASRDEALGVTFHASKPVTLHCG